MNEEKKGGGERERERERDSKIQILHSLIESIKIKEQIVRCLFGIFNAKSTVV